ncbi:hypothetical protein [Anabaena lutea]|uniref:Uncharacterized protein n=1 Tax=Anabaena lutea FACHB-196 TaxID=2692881 RepID=A0ABR8FG67_9NOST|nr:hypothetical protein [Anabaena lutea]MBD2567790.1 hypothetical protein [Anabaena lutea FACHB-196]
MTNTSNQFCPECQDAENSQKIDIKCILDKLESEKKYTLSPGELRYLCLCLTLCSRYEIAFRLENGRKPTIEQIKNKEEKIVQKAKNLSSEMSNKVHLYIKQFMGISEDRKRIPPWSSVLSFFKNKGCECNKNKSLHQPLSNKFLFIMEIEGFRSKEEIINSLNKIGIRSNITMIRRVENE